MRFISLFTAISSISITLACGGGDEDTSTDNALCDPGSTQICVGSGVCEGVQVCNLEGTTWGVCDCGGGEAGSPGTGGAETGGNEPGGAEPVGTGGSAGSEPDDGGAETGGSDEGTGGSEETGGTEPTGGFGIGGADTGGSEPTGGTETGGAETGGEAGAETGGTTGGAGTGDAGSGTGGEVCVPVYDRTDPELACQLKAMELAGVTIEDLQAGAEMPDACGYIDDGCGNPIDCNGCAEYKGCGVGEIELLLDGIEPGETPINENITVNNKTPSLCQGNCVGFYNYGYGDAWVSCLPGQEIPDLFRVQWVTDEPTFALNICDDLTELFPEEEFKAWSCHPD